MRRRAIKNSVCRRQSNRFLFTPVQVLCAIACLRKGLFHPFPMHNKLPIFPTYQLARICEDHINCRATRSTVSGGPTGTISSVRMACSLLPWESSTCCSYQPCKQASRSELRRSEFRWFFSLDGQDINLCRPALQNGQWIMPGNCIPRNVAVLLLTNCCNTGYQRQCHCTTERFN